MVSFNNIPVQSTSSSNLVHFHAKMKSNRHKSIIPNIIEKIIKADFLKYNHNITQDQMASFNKAKYLYIIKDSKNKTDKPLCIFIPQNKYNNELSSVLSLTALLPKSNSRNQKIYKLTKQDLSNILQKCNTKFYSTLELISLSGNKLQFNKSDFPSNQLKSRYEHRTGQTVYTFNIEDYLLNTNKSKRKRK